MASFASRSAKLLPWQREAEAKLASHGSHCIAVCRSRKAKVACREGGGLQILATSAGAQTAGSVGNPCLLGSQPVAKALFSSPHPSPRSLWSSFSPWIINLPALLRCVTNSVLGHQESQSLHGLGLETRDFVLPSVDMVEAVPRLSLSLVCLGSRAGRAQGPAIWGRHGSRD